MSGQGRKYKSPELISRALLNDQNQHLKKEGIWVLSHYDSWLPNVHSLNRNPVAFINRLQIPENFPNPSTQRTSDLTFRVR